MGISIRMIVILTLVAVAAATTYPRLVAARQSRQDRRALANAFKSLDQGREELKRNPTQVRHSAALLMERLNAAESIGAGLDDDTMVFVDSLTARDAVAIDDMATTSKRSKRRSRI